MPQRRTCLGSAQPARRHRVAQNNRGTPPSEAPSCSSRRPALDAQRRNGGGNVDWPLHNLDLAGTRSRRSTRSTRRNVKTLTPRWLFQHGVIDGVSNQTTPVVVDGTMYVTDPRGSVYAVDAADGHLLWTYDVTNLIGGGRARGLHLPQPRRLLRRRRRLHGRRARSCSRSTPRPESRFQASATTARRSVILDVLQAAIPGGEDGDQHGVLVHDGAAGPQRRDLHRQHAQREPHSRRARAGRRREDRQGALALQHHSAGREGSGLGDRRSDLGRRRAQRRRDLGDAVDRSGAGAALRGGRRIRSATARSAPA